MAVTSASSLRKVLANHQLSDTERLACLSHAGRWIDQWMHYRDIDRSLFAKHAINGKVRVAVHYLASGWGNIDDSSTRYYTVKANVYAYERFCKELRDDCDGCDASVEIVPFIGVYHD